jgi:thiol:disulfide interchange protein DsbD
LRAIGDSPWGAAFAQAAGRGEVLAAVPSAQGYRPAGEEGVDKADWNFTPVPFAPGLEVSGLFSAILLGMLAGLVLNAMPCVLPVVSLKLSAFLSGAAEEDAALRVRRFREHNLFFALGILLWFGLLAAILGGGGMAWGELFQSAWLVGALAALLFMLAMSLLGLFHLPVIDLKFDQAVSHPRLKALSTGMLATLLATPCSGPFLGGVLGWALLRPGAEIAVVFLAVGAGMALPYFVFIAFPGAARFFPRPGAWLAEVERAVALFLLGSCVYLVSILPDVGLLPWLISAWCLGTAWWLARIGKAARRKAGKALAFALALVLAVGGPVWAFQPALGHDGWTPFEPASFRAMLGEELLAVDFTADWCPTCKFLEATVLTPENVRRFSREHGARFVRVDLSRNDPAAEELLKALGSQSIPVMAVFPPGERASSPILIRDLFTAGHLEEALGAARGAEQ